MMAKSISTIEIPKATPLLTHFEAYEWKMIERSFLRPFLALQKNIPSFGIEVFILKNCPVFEFYSNGFAFVGRRMSGHTIIKLSQSSHIQVHQSSADTKTIIWRRLFG